MFSNISIADYWQDIVHWFNNVVWTPATGWQAAVTLVLIVPVAFALAGVVKKRLSRWTESREDGTLANKLAVLVLPAVWALLQWLAVYAYRQLEFSHGLLEKIGAFLLAWLTIRIVSEWAHKNIWSRIIKTFIWITTLLYIFEMLGDAQRSLTAISVNWGAREITALVVVKAVVTFIVLWWGAGVVTGVVVRQLKNSATISSSFQVLLGNLTKLGAYGIAIILSLTGAGFDLAALAFFGGALGIGIGFGMKTIVANFVSGLIILLEKSIKPGDVIAVSGKSGQITSLRARYVSVVTRDGIEHLIPNEQLTSERVENWSHSSSLVRLRIPVAISPNTDVRLALKLCAEAALECKRVKSEPPPKCRIRAFESSAIVLDLQAWIDDPQNGTSGVRHECLLNIWDRFQEHNIEFPYPQQDIRITSMEPKASLDNKLASDADA